MVNGAGRVYGSSASNGHCVTTSPCWWSGFVRCGFDFCWVSYPESCRGDLPGYHSLGEVHFPPNVLREKEQFLEALRSRGQRVTRERLALLDEIFVQHQHIDADSLLAALHQRGYSISRATVYRNLDLLVRLGLVRKTRLGHDRFLFEHVHAGHDHDHLVCTSCGRVVEFVSPGIAALQAEICRAHGFVPTHHTLEILGLCNNCAAAREAAGQGHVSAAKGGTVGAAKRE